MWLNDELMVSPAAVAGLIVRSEDDSYGKTFGVSRWVNVILLSGKEEQVWSVSVEVPIEDGGEALKDRVSRKRLLQREAAEAEMERLSRLLWPPVSPGMLFVPEEPEAEPLLSNSLMGVASARARYRGFPKPPFTVRAEAAVAAVDALNAVVDGWCAGPNRQCGSMSNAGERCGLPFGHELPHVDAIRNTSWMLTDHI